MVVSQQLDNMRLVTITIIFLIFGVFIIQILSWDEVRRRKAIDDIEKYIPLPELKSESLFLNENHIKQVWYILCYIIVARYFC